MSRTFQSQFEQSVNCNFFGLDLPAWAAIIGTVASVAVSGVSLISSQNAASQSAANAQAVANYNAQIQQQNADIALQMSTYQAQQNAAVSTQQNALLVSQQQQQTSVAQSNLAIAQSQEQLTATTAAMEGAVSQSNADVATLNATFARQQADAAQQRYEAGMENAKQLDLYAEQVQAQQREEAKRLREEDATRQASLRAKYGASGVTFEGSPLVVLADSARLAEALVQDSAFVSELEARKQQREAVMARFEAPFSLIDKQGFLNQAAGYEAEARGHELEGEFSSLQGAADVFALQIEQFNQSTTAAQIGYEGEIQKSRFETDLAAANYDTLVAGERNKIALAQADLTRFEGGVTASGILADSQASLISGIGSIGSSVASGVSTVAKSLPKKTTVGQIR